MFVNIVGLRSFYASPLGRHVQTAIASALEPSTESARHECVMGFGYAVPYLDPFYTQAERCFAFMPAQQGASLWPNTEHVATALITENALPLSEASVDRIILAHGLEQMEDAEESLRELWRVLTPEGRINIVVANRRGLWARAEFTPFGHGEPYSHSQLQHLLQKTGFTFGPVQEALHFLPYENGRINALSHLYEKMAQRLFPYFGGVLVVEAQKKLYKRLTVAKRAPKRVLVPGLRPQTSVRLAPHIVTEE